MGNHNHSHHHNHGPAKTPEEILKEAHMSVTRPRLEILCVFLKGHGPFSADDVAQKLPDGFCDQATIFRTLKQFKEKKILKLIQFQEDFARYELNQKGHHHHHIVCEDCGKVEVLETCPLDELLKEARAKGFKVKDHALELFGQCRKCAK